MEKLEHEITALRARAEMLTKRHAAAETALSTAKAALQRHHLECELDGPDDKVRVKLEAAIASCALTRDGYADAVADVREKIGDAEQKLAMERTVPVASRHRTRWRVISTRSTRCCRTFSRSRAASSTPSARSVIGITRAAN